MNVAPALTPTAPAPMVDIVLPVYNEEAILDRSVRRLHKYLYDRFPFPARITIVDNASTDATCWIARSLARELDGVRALQVAQKGRGGALKLAWLRSDAEVVAYMDADLSTDLDALLPLVAPLISGHSDLSIGSRLSNGARVVRSAKRELISRCYNLLLHLTLHVKVRDAQCGFKAMRADAARRLLPQVEDQRWFFDTELLVLAERAGLRIHEVAVDWTEDSDSRVDVFATAVENLMGILRISGAPASHTVRQLAWFAVIGALSTAAYALLFLLLRPVIPAIAANAVALAATAITNTAANRRFTFGVQGRDGLAGDHLGGFMALALALGLTNLSIAGLHAVSSNPSPSVELAVLVAANAVATVARFVLLRALVFERRRQYARVVQIRRRHS